MSELLDAVDDTEDPSPPATGKYTVRVKGEARNVPLVAAKKYWKSCPSVDGFKCVACTSGQ